MAADADHVRQARLGGYLRAAMEAAVDAGDEAPISLRDLDRLSEFVVRRYSSSAQKPPTEAAIIADLATLGRILRHASDAIKAEARERAKRETAAAKERAAAK